MAAAPVPTDRWTDADFDALSWHDNHVHALRIVAGPHGAGELHLDLDFIVEWICRPEGGARFRIVPATLRFLEVTHLRIALDYATPTAALGPFSLGGIARRFEPRDRHTAQVWTLDVNWPAGEIRFEAAGFVQTATGAARLGDNQWLEPAERGPTP